MKTMLWLGLALMSLPTFSLFAQTDSLRSSGISASTLRRDTVAPPANGDATVRAVILGEIQKEHEVNSQEVKKQLNKFETRIAELDAKLAKEKNDQKRVENLVERVQVLEQKETTVNENVLSVFQHNYQSAVINLMFMERELKPLELFQSSRDFFTSLANSANPMNYPGFNDWFNGYKSYVDQNKRTEAKLMVVDRFMSLAGNFSKGIPLAGPLTSTLIDGVSLFMNSMKRNDPRREQSMKMIELIALLSQFGHDMLEIENEWEAINKELAELQRLQNDCLQQNFELLGIRPSDFERQFTRQMDANKRIDYVKDITKIVRERVKTEREKNPEKWKTVFHYQMQQVQSLKIRFGNLTFRIKENIEEYKLLINKYSNVGNPDIASRMKDLQTKLERLNSSFDATFSPQSYIESATQMYIVD